MKRILLLLTVVALMVAMMMVLAGTAMAHSVAAGNPCPSGLETAHAAVPGTPQTEVAHHNIPCLPH
jgi:high-affinity Fe2+/Pb2+ permease